MVASVGSACMAIVGDCRQAVASVLDDKGGQPAGTAARVVPVSSLAAAADELIISDLLAVEAHPMASWLAIRSSEAASRLGGEEISGGIVGQEEIN